MTDTDERDKQLNVAIEEAFAALVAGMDINAAAALWRRLCRDVFTDQLELRGQGHRRCIRCDGEREATARGRAVPRGAGTAGMSDRMALNRAERSPPTDGERVAVTVTVTVTSAVADLRSVAAASEAVRQPDAVIAAALGAAVVFMVWVVFG